MKKILVLALLLPILAIIACGVEEKQPTSQPQISEIKKELEGWAEGRWQNFTVGYNSSENELLIRIWVEPIANETAMKGYCDIAKKIASKWAVDQRYYAFIYKGNKIAHTCR